MTLVLENPGKVLEIQLCSPEILHENCCTRYIAHDIGAVQLSCS